MLPEPADLARGLVITSLRLDPDGLPNLVQILTTADIDLLPWPAPRILLHEPDPTVLVTALAEVDSQADHVAGIRGPAIIHTLRDAIRVRISELHRDLASWPRPPLAIIVLLQTPAPRPDLIRSAQREHPDGPGPISVIQLEDMSLEEAQEAVDLVWAGFSAGGPGERVPPGWVWSNSGELADTLAERYGTRVASYPEAADAWRQVATNMPRNPEGA